MAEYQPFPHMPSSKDGKPYLDDAGKPVILHTQQEEDEFRAAHDDAAPRAEPVRPPAESLEEARAENDALRSENASLRAEIEALHAAKAADVDTDAPGGKKGKK